jgi:hypothetical protein
MGFDPHRPDADPSAADEPAAAELPVSPPPLSPPPPPLPKSSPPPAPPPVSSANYPGWMPPGTSVPPGLPGPPSRLLSSKRRGYAGCVVSVVLVIVVALGLIWFVRTLASR